jgi:hypothetical protein
MKNRSGVMSKGDKIVGVAPRISRRAIELFQDNRFKPRIIKNKRAYTRKGRGAERAGNGD